MKLFKKHPKYQEISFSVVYKAEKETHDIFGCFLCFVNWNTVHYQKNKN